MPGWHRCEAREGLAHFHADQGGQERIPPELVVVVEILIPHCQAVDPLGYKLLDGVFDQVWVAVVDKTGGKLSQDAGPLFDLAQEQPTGVRTDCSPVEGPTTSRRPRG